MQVIPRCRNLLIIQKHLHFPSSTQFASFHSTPFCEEKWKNQGKFSPAKLKKRQKRADRRRANKTILDHCDKLEDSFKKNIGGHSNSSRKGGQRQYDAQRAEKIRAEKIHAEKIRAEKIHNNRTRRNFRKGYLSEDEDYHPETVFEATFGDRYYTWSTNGGSSRRSNPGFDWRNTFRRASGNEEEWETSNKPDSEDEMYTVGSRTDRSVLGLPLVGPLKMEDVKTAFHLSALKWHPDKHQGPMQAEAAEKFKICLSSYKSLCSALSRV